MRRSADDDQVGAGEHVGVGLIDRYDDDIGAGVGSQAGRDGVGDEMGIAVHRFVDDDCLH